MLVMILTEVLTNGCGDDGDDDDNDDDIAVDSEVFRGISESMKLSLRMTVLIKLLMNGDNAHKYTKDEWSTGLKQSSSVYRSLIIFDQNRSKVRDSHRIVIG